MSFLSNLFGSKTIPEKWNELVSLEDLNRAESESYKKPIVLFKHSVTCGISAAAKHRLESGFDLDSKEVEVHYLDLLSHRDISNEIANRYNVIHQSPQLIILINGEAVFNASHHAVSLDLLKQQLTVSGSVE